MNKILLHIPTKKDVARLAGVSHMTVSRVLSNYTHVSTECRRKVWEACRKLKYRQNNIAATLRTGKSNILGVVVPTFKHVFYARLLNQVETECLRAGYHMITIHGTMGNTGEPITWAELDFLLTRRIDALLVAVYLSPEVVKKLKSERIPVVFVDIPPSDHRFPFIGVDNFGGMAELTRYLIQMGHRDIAFLAGYTSSYTSRQRLAGYKAALGEAGVRADDKLIRFTNYSWDGGYKAAQDLIAKDARFSALLGANDYIAMGAMAALSQHNIRIPDQVSVGGFAGDDASEYAIPPLTTMFQPIETIASMAVEILLEIIRGKPHPNKRIILPVSLIKRSSVQAR